MNGRVQEPEVLRFGSFELVRASGELRKSGALIGLQSQQFQLLALLAERGGEVVSREEIRRTLWSNETFVDFDQSINLCVNKIRKALGDDPQDPQYIETLPRKGYRFIAPITEVGVEGTEGEAILKSGVFSRRVLAAKWQLLSVGVAVVVVAISLAAKMAVSSRSQPKPIESLAVLPLENLSNDPEQDYFADGMTDDLITDLAKIRALRVISRMSVMQYKGTKKPVPEIARELKVDAVLEGTVTRDQNRVRITAQLIGAAPEKHIWAEKYEVGSSEVLAVQDAVAQAVAREIQIKVTPQEQARLTQSRVIDPEAHEAYLKGRYLWERSGEPNLKRSREYFEKAIDKDPGYALAWSGLADTFNRLANWGVVSRQEAAPRARAAAEKALQLDSSLVEPLVALAEVKMQYEWDWAGAEQLFKKAIEISPSYGPAHQNYALYLAEVGRAQEAVTEARRAHEADPLAPIFAVNVVWFAYIAHQYDQAELESRKLLEWDPRLTGEYILASVYLQTGRPREALAELQKDAEYSHRSILELMYLGHALGVSGEREKGRKVLEEMQRLSQRRYVPPEFIAVVYEGLGERDLALQWFEKAFAQRSMHAWILPDPRLDQIRTEPRFNALMRRMGLPQ
jgi:TolB-like protein/DNA-binding winged helix-turn-helix (wHTH) protein/Tfp pilus assembly protein PilF